MLRKTSSRLSLAVISPSAKGADSLAQLLRDGGYDVTFECIRDATQLKPLLQQKPRDLIVIECEGTAIEPATALTILKEMNLETPVIVVGNTVNEAQASEWIKAGARDCLRKDNLTRLVAVIER